VSAYRFLPSSLPSSLHGHLYPLLILTLSFSCSHPFPHPHRITLLSASCLLPLLVLFLFLSSSSSSSIPFYSSPLSLCSPSSSCLAHLPLIFSTSPSPSSFLSLLPHRRLFSSSVPYYPLVLLLILPFLSSV
jgi:hypothetical protein